MTIDIADRAKAVRGAITLFHKIYSMDHAFVIISAP